MNPQSHCSRTDAVLAYHLDGDLDDQGLNDAGYGFACGASLHDHLRECAACQRALQRARRLDAALATAAGRAVAGHPLGTNRSWTALTQRWLDQAVAHDPKPAPAAPIATAAHVPTGAGARPLRLPQLPLAALAIATGIATFVLWPRPTLPAAGPTTTANNLAAVSTTPMPPILISPVRATEPVAAAATPPAVALPIPLVGPTRPRPTPRTMPEAALSPRLLAVRIGDATVAAQERLNATRLLVQACRSQASAPTRALRELVPVLAALGDSGPLARDLHTRQLDLLRAHDDVVTLLQSTVALLESSSRRLVRDELAAVLVAARLGRPELDRTLRRVLRQKPETIDIVAAALRCGVRAAGGASLLLDAWHDADARHPGALDEATAMAWFRRQPATFVDELTFVLRHERSADARIRCLLALGGTDEAAAAPVLFAALDSPHLDESIAAAFALAHLPPDVLEAVAAQHGTDGEPLLRIALARARVPLALPWLDALGLDDVARRRLHHGDRQAFGEFVVWFRDRAAFGG